MVWEKKEDNTVSRIKKWPAIMSVITAFGLGTGTGKLENNITNSINERTIQVNALDLEEKIEFRRDGSQYELYKDLMPFFIIIKKSFNIQNESDVQNVLNAINQILIYLETKKKEYGGPTNSKYNFNEYEPDLKQYFRYVIANLKVKYPNNSQLKSFYIK